jgi:[ribosomal protein S5]-alanine N-acetyltransferase
MSEHPAATERLTFRCWRDDDRPLALALYGDPRVTALVGGPFDAAAVDGKLATELANQRAHRIAYWPIFLHDGAHVGCCGLKPRDSRTIDRSPVRGEARIGDSLGRGSPVGDPAARIYELGFYLLPDRWGAGFAAEAGRSVIAYAFDVLDAASLFAGHHPENHGSRRALEKLGFRYLHHELYPPTGLQHPCYARSRHLA